MSPSFVHYDINHVLGTGQSLSVGSVGTPPLTLTQPYDNLSFVTGVMTEATGLTSFIPLVEGDLCTGTTIAVETMSSGMANLVTKMARESLLVDQPAGKTSHDLLVSVHGLGGIAYSGLKKGTSAYATGMAQVTAGKALTTDAGKSYVVRAVTNVHGESDHVALNANYAADLAQWQADYEADVKALTGQSEPIPMFQTQMSSWTKLGTPLSTTSAIPLAQLAAHVASGGKIVLVGPKYHLPYAPDGVHLTNVGYRHMGEDYAKAYRRVVMEGKPWEPIRPRTITRKGAVITVTFHVPSPPLALDTTRVTDPGNYGFEYVDDSDVTPGIDEIVVSSADTVTITLFSAPTGANARLRYAYRGIPGAPGGPKTGPRGNLRDSDSTASRNGDPLYNWCVHFDEPVP
ncbi:Endo-1,4-beta-xylanase Z precursor [Labilithrix luteola]|uniref:Endo-1,4-beta-xylanase Z n=1 Tax=Labilithrix luteola TaxID=1391654 RepID=A0A0K1Q166_9BACT|nr:Endo-1,4-beta-xylanase Z precursor [Labilithrix luteola]